MYGSDFTATGVANHSEADRDFFICSVDKAGDSEKTKELNRATFTNSLTNNKIEFKTLEGCYNDVKEVSYLINQKHYPLYRKMLLSFGQETVLLLENHKHGLYKASLDHIKNISGSRVEYLGYLRSVPKDIALKHSGYSYDPIANTYFIVTDSDTTILSELKELGLTA